MSDTPSVTKVGVYVDAANIVMNGGYGMRFDVLRRFACRDGSQAVRLNVYLAFDEDRARLDQAYRNSNREFHLVLRDLGYKVIQKPVKRYVDDKGNQVVKSNADLDLAVDALLQSDNLDRVLLVSGDGDFVQVVRALQNKGCRVEAMAFRNVSGELRREADLFLSGYLVPNLLPFEDRPKNQWGESGHRVRGVCYHYEPQRGFGFVRFLTKLTPFLWVTDTRLPESPYETAFLHYSEIRFEDRQIQDELPSRDLILEFELVKEDRGFVAKNVEVTYSYSGTRRQGHGREPNSVRRIDGVSRTPIGEFGEWPEEVEEMLPQDDEADGQHI